MSDRRLSDRDRRALLVAAGAVAVTLFLELVAFPAYRGHRETTARLARESRQLRGDLRVVAEAKAATSVYRRGAERLLAAAPRTFPAPPRGTATRALLGRLRTLAEEAHVYVAEARPVQGEDGGDSGVRRLRASLVGETDFEGLITFLRLLEVDERLLAVDRLEARVPADSARVRGGGAEVLTVGLRVVGFQLPRRDSAGPLASPRPRRRAFGEASP